MCMSELGQLWDAKDIGGLSLISPDDATKLLTSKWIIQALLPSHANLQILLGF